MSFHLSQIFTIYAANNNVHIIQPRLAYVSYDIKLSDTGLQITTDKRTYFKGETVNITVRNGSYHAIKFPNSILGLIIENVNTGRKAGLTGVQMISELKPLESRSIKWDQKDTEVKQVKPGIYQAKISSISNNTSKERQISAANTTFAIRSDR